MSRKLIEIELLINLSFVAVFLNPELPYAVCYALYSTTFVFAFLHFRFFCVFALLFFCVFVFLSFCFFEF